MNIKNVGLYLGYLLLMILTWYTVSAFCVYNVYVLITDERLINIAQNPIIFVVGAVVTLIVFVGAWLGIKKRH